MEITSPMQLKVTLSEADLAENGLSYNDLDYGNEESRQFLRSLLRRAQDNSGFKCKTFSKMMIEVFPAPGGGCVIYFTCTAPAAPVPAKLRLRRTGEEAEIYAFQNSGDLIDAVRAVSRMYPGRAARLKSTLYLSDGGYRLLISDRGDMEEIGFILGEYGKKLGSGRAAAAYLSEHGKMLAEGNAFARMSILAR